MSKKLKEMAADAAAEWIKGSETDNSLVDACAMYGYDCGFQAGYKAAQEHAHAALEEAEARIDRLETNAQGWISVKDRLPELKETLLDLWNESDVVLIVVKPMETTPQFATQARLRSCPRSYWEPGFWAACKIDSHNEWETDEWTLQQVTHWMPLPAAPKEEE
jgi:hypothetical protein